MSHLHSVRGQLQYSQHKEKHYSRNNTTYVHWCLLYNTLSSKVRFNSIIYTNTRGARNLHIKWLSAEYYWSTFKQWGACITLAFLRTTIHWPSLPSKLPDLNWLTSYTLCCLTYWVLYSGRRAILRIVKYGGWCSGVRALPAQLMGPGFNYHLLPTFHFPL